MSKAREILKKNWDEWLEVLADYWVEEDPNRNIWHAEEIMQEGKWDGYIYMFDEDDFEWDEVVEWVVEKLKTEGYTKSIEEVRKELGDLVYKFYVAAAIKINRRLGEKLMKLVKKYNYAIRDKYSGSKILFYFYPRSWNK